MAELILRVSHSLGVILLLIGTQNLLNAIRPHLHSGCVYSSIFALTLIDEHRLEDC